VETLRKRGHVIRVLTSTHGVGVEQRDAEIERRLLLNGAFGHEAVSGFYELRSLESRNNAALREVIAEFQPEIVHVWSLQALSKSLLSTLRESRLPTAFDVADDWLAAGIRLDPWLGWWNRPSAPLLSGIWRKLLEVAAQRNRIDAGAPTRMMQGYDRIPEVYGSPKLLEGVQPDSICAFRFERLYFSSHLLKSKAEQAGFQVQHADVIYPGIRAEVFAGQVRPLASPVKRFLLATRLVPENGVMTALEAFRLARQYDLAANLTIYGRGESDYVAKLKSFVINHQLPVEFITVSDLVRDMPAVYRQHDAFLHTAEWEEPFATAPLEAMASGLPVIAARSGGVQEVLRHGETAFTYELGNAADLACRLQEIQLQPALRSQVAENGQTEVMSRFNENAMVDRIESFLETTRQVWE
jgi:glycosyltransferase involved in cell wall biosynthesis